MIGRIARLARRSVLVVFVFGCSGGVGCVVATEEEGVLDLPDRASFPLVADALERRCATLDCHGATSRNLRLYAGNGLRLDPADVSGSGSTTEAEYEASYRSVVGLEPEILSAVLLAGGSAPERLTLVRKARGLEDHAAGAVLQAGAPADRCMTSWLASAIDEPACVRGAEVAPPEWWPGGGDEPP
jgi:hypothetical protein